jgi:hypothetical protein
MARPLKNHITLGAAYREAEAKIEQVIGPVLNVQFPSSPEVKEADIRILAAEADQLCHGRKHWTTSRSTSPPTW